MTIAWTTGEPVVGTVEYGLDTLYGAVAGGPAATREHVVTLTELSAGTAYHYRLLLDGVPVEGDHVFETFPSEPESPFRFAVFADGGTGGAAQRQVAAQIAASSAALVLIAGDVVYSYGTAAEITAHYFKPYAGLIDRSVFYPVLGNHDVRTQNGKPLLDAVYLPTNDSDGTERFFSFDYANAHFVGLDSCSDLSSGSLQRAWLDSDLSTSAAAWKFVYLHRPPFSSSYHGSSMDLRASLEPIFDKHHVDIVFAGHDHDYERTYPLASAVVVGADEDPNYSSPAGVVYIVTGGGGDTLYASGASYFTAFSKSVFHFVQVDIEGLRLELRAIRTDGSTLDQMTITKTP